MLLTLLVNIKLLVKLAIVESNYYSRLYSNYNNSIYIILYHDILLTLVDIKVLVKLAIVESNCYSRLYSTLSQRRIVPPEPALLFPDALIEHNTSIYCICPLTNNHKNNLDDSSDAR